MRILYVSAEAVPGSDGGAVHTMAVAGGLVRRGHAVTLLTRRGSGQAASETLGGVRVLRARMRLAGKTVPALALPRLLGLDPGRFDVVMARFAALGGSEGIFAERGELPLVLEVNSPQVAEVIWRYRLDGGLSSRLLEAWGERQFSRAAAVVSPSDRIVPAWARPRCRLMSWGCDTDRFRPFPEGEAERARERLGLSGRFVVAFSGSFRGWHGVDLLPLLAKALLPRRPEAVFLCLGEGDRRLAVAAEARRLGLEGAFRFLGALPPSAMPGHLGAAHAGIAPFQVAAYPPFQRFGFFYSPLKVFEYLACGLPVVTTACPELAALVREGETGHLLAEGDLEGMAGALSGLAGDPARRSAMGVAARKEAEERFSWHAHVEALEGILKEVTHARGD